MESKIHQDESLQPSIHQSMKDRQPIKGTKEHEEKTEEILPYGEGPRQHRKHPMDGNHVSPRSNEQRVKTRLEGRITEGS